MEPKIKLSSKSRASKNANITRLPAQMLLATDPNHLMFLFRGSPYLIASGEEGGGEASHHWTAGQPQALQGTLASRGREIEQQRGAVTDIFLSALPST